MTNAACLPGLITDVLSALATCEHVTTAVAPNGAMADTVFQELLGLGLQELDQTATPEATANLPSSSTADEAAETSETPEAQFVRVLTSAVAAVVSQVEETTATPSADDCDDRPADDDKEETDSSVWLDTAPVLTLPVQTTPQRDVVFALNAPQTGAGTEGTATLDVSAPTRWATSNTEPDTGDVTAEPLASAPQIATQDAKDIADALPVVVTGRMEPKVEANADATAQTTVSAPETGVAPATLSASAVSEAKAEQPASSQATLPSSTASAHTSAETTEVRVDGTQPQTEAASTIAAKTDVAQHTTPVAARQETDTSAGEQADGDRDSSSRHESQRKSTTESPEPARHMSATGTVATTSESTRSSSTQQPAGVVKTSAETATTRTADVQDPATPTSTVKDLAVKVATPGGGEVSLQFAESRGTVNLTLRTADEGLATALQSDLPQLGARLEAAGWRSNLQATTSGSTSDLSNNSDAAVATERGSSTRWQAETALRTDEAGMQFGAGGEGGHAASDAAEQEDDFLTLTALRRLSGLRGTL